MKALLATSICAFLLLLNSSGFAATRYVNLNNLNPIAPYTDWSTAATNIQDAIEAATPGDVVLVTNGIYGTGGKVKAGDLTNRVAIDKAITVQSVNGAAVTIIDGGGLLTGTNGPAAVRGVWLTNGATVNGFTIRGGATRAVASPVNSQMSGGGIWGSSTNAMAVDCVIADNQASYQGGGAYQVTMLNCVLSGNRAVGSGLGYASSGIAGAGQGGGAANSYLKNCLIRSNQALQGYGGGVISCIVLNSALVENSTYGNGGGVYGGWLVNCSIVGNTSSSGSFTGYGAAVHSAALTNCLVWGNFSRSASYPDTNYANSTLSYSLSSPLAAGVGNLAVDPQLFTDRIHLTETSPCRGMGTNIVTGTDLDGQAWSNPPSIGCDEWQPTPVMTFAPTYQVEIPARRLTFNVAIAGQSPSCFWSKDGVPLQDDDHYTNSQSPNLNVLKFGPEHAGEYRAVASNSFGMFTSQVARVAIRCVNVAGNSPGLPYLTWATAATNIQDAIEVASPGDIVLVTNGTYNVGGKIKEGDLLNRVAIDKALFVTSMNGHKVTAIQGAWDAATNGPAAVRCVWIGPGAVLAGFTIRDGATRSSGVASLQNGGGVWSPDMNAGGTVRNCLITNNAADRVGGGVYGALLQNCILTANSALYGGGAANAELRNCTVKNNFCVGDGGGTYEGIVRNSIVVGNFTRSPSVNQNYQIVPPLNFFYSCSLFFPSGGGVNGNIYAHYAQPPFSDSEYHLPASSPCRGAGSPIYASGEDMDGDPWANPPSMGADEVIEADFIGPISVSLEAARSNTLVGSFHALPISALVTGWASRMDWDFGDGVVVTNAGYEPLAHWWTNTGTFTVTATAYNNDNPSGVSASIEINVLPLLTPTIEGVSCGSNGFQFTFVAQELGRYTMQYTTNLAAPVTWSTLQTISSSPGGTTVITDPVATNAARFYRVRVQ